MKFRIAVWLSAFFAFFAVFHFFDSGSSPDQEALQQHLGIWTPEDGPPENRMIFWNVTKDSPVPGARVSEGRVRVKGLLGREAADGVWNYGNWEPLRLNVVFADGGYTAAVRRLDPDHLLIRFSADVRELIGDDVFKHADTMRLKRVPGEPFPPTEPAKLWY